uniref:Golgin subfamily A member 6-like protein 22 isoform X3 n=1 Tax=Crassostrea virginica TaxID=6565 RepID=A0A8B8B409_CRAVI|nr:golgin subfamily A member 6-like protein 22 isoform X3 [Crassostrea virginica]
MDSDCDDGEGEGLQKAKGTSTYRQLMRTENKAKYEIYLQEQKQRMKEYRSRIKQDPKKLQEQREKAKVRQKKYRDKKKEEGKESRTKSKEVHASAPNTRTRVEEKRQKWRESKRKYRKKLSMSQKVWIKRKDRDRKRRIKEEMCNNNLSSTSDILSSQKIFQNKQSLYNMTYKARKVLPKSPKKFASIIQKLVQNSTPKKRKAVDQLLGSSAGTSTWERIAINKKQS